MPPVSVAVPETLVLEAANRRDLHHIERARLEGEIAGDVSSVPVGLAGLPGANVPPLMIVVGPAIPVPESVPPELTVTPDELAIEPSLPACRR